MPTSFDPAQSLLIDDFDTFVRYLESKPNLPLTAGGDLKAANLWAINERVNHKAPNYVTNRSRQIDYPLLGSLFQVATVSRLFLVNFVKGSLLTPDADRLSRYKSLTLEEKYIFLVETAWCYADWSAIATIYQTGLLALDMALLLAVTGQPVYYTSPGPVVEVGWHSCLYTCFSPIQKSQIKFRLAQKLSEN